MLKRIKARIEGMRESAANLVARKPLYYVVEPADWVIKDVGRNVMRRMPELPSRITTIPGGIRGSMVHFGSIHTYAESTVPRAIHASNRIAVTWFHVVDGDARLKHLARLDDGVRIWHTASSLTKAKLVSAGLPEGKIRVVPLGVDLDAFRPRGAEFRQALRKRLGIPEDRVVIGSFQKDGVGWGEGSEPKLIKGPDLFCDAVERLAREHKVTVLLTGPARGYVKGRLRAAGIPFVHTFFEKPQEVAEYYQALDLYIVSSREEGGPMQILESMASGVPLVSMSVGMAPDLLVDGENGLLVPLERAADLPGRCLDLLGDPAKAERMAAKAIATASAYGWETIAETYRRRIYAELA